MKDKNTGLYIIICTIILVAIIGTTFAYFSASITETDKTETNIKAAKLGIVFDGTREIDAQSIEPGWSAQKKFTVENTSDYDMTYDINFTKVANNFVNTSDLTASGAAVYVQGTNGQTQSGTVKMVAIDATSVAGNLYDFALPNNNSYVLPVDNTADFTGSTPVVGTNVYRVARVFIPAHAKEEITITLSYAYKAPTSGYTLGDPTDPNNQNADQGKIFKTTFAIVANGIDTGSTQNNANNTTINTDENQNNNTSSQTFNGTKVAATVSDTHKGIVYLDPSNPAAECLTTSTLTTVNIGCKKFYIFDDNGSNYKMIMDRNTTSNVAWNTDEENSNHMMREVQTALDTSTSGWIGNPELITADEIATIVGNQYWNSTTATQTERVNFGSKGTREYPSQLPDEQARHESFYWLFDYTQDCTTYGCQIADNSTKGYWTSTALVNDDYYVWIVNRKGMLTNYDATETDYYGVRPVITVAKSLID